MNCKRVKKLLSGLLDKGISEGLQEELLKHIERCPACKEEYNEIKNLNKLLQAQKAKEPREEYWQGYWDRLEKRFVERTFKKKRPMLERLRELYMPFLPLPDMQLAFRFATVAVLILVCIVSFRIGKHTGSSAALLQGGLYDQSRLPFVLAKYEKQGYPKSVAKAVVAQTLVKDFFGNLAALYKEEGLDEFVTYISKNGYGVTKPTVASTARILEKGKDYDTTITIPDVWVGEKKVIIKAAARHEL